jgi:hypothetical protein
MDIGLFQNSIVLNRLHPPLSLHTQSSLNDSYDLLVCDAECVVRASPVYSCRDNYVFDSTLKAKIRFPE